MGRIVLLRAFFGRLVCALATAGILLILPGCSSAPPSPYYNYIPPPAPPTPSPPPAPYTPSPSGARVVQQCLVAPAESRSVVHEVGPMETLWRISKMYDVPIEAICEANGLAQAETIHIGQKLTIPNCKTFRNVIPLYPNGKWKYIIVHHTATDIGNALLINRSHNDRGFWYGLGYDFLIDNGTLGKGDGQIEASPRWIKQQDGAHCKAGGMNHTGIGVSLVGNFNYETPTPKQLESLAYLVQTLARYYHIPQSNVMGHGDVPGANTDCPGKLFPWASLRRYFAGM